MNIRLLAFTDQGFALACRLAEEMGGQAFRCGAEVSLHGWTRENFLPENGLIFVGAAGIAVRAIAPYVKSKTCDPAVVVLEEKGRFVIPILSGHLGGANDLARRIARLCGAVPVITTATDVNGCFPVDQWARCQGLAVENPQRIKLVSSKVLAGERVSFRSDYPVRGSLPDGIVPAQEETCDIHITARCEPEEALKLIPPVITLGVGCRRGTSMEALEEAFQTVLTREGRSKEAVYQVCTIDLKQDEAGLLAFCRRHGLPLMVFSPEELAKVPGEFPASDFVRQVTGVDNVCQRAAVLGSGGCLLGERYQNNGVTMALAERSYPLDWSYQDE